MTKRAGIPEEREVLARAGSVSTDGFVRYLLELVRREVGRVRDRAKAGNERSVDVSDARPVDSVEERMVLDLLDAQTVVRGRDQPRKLRMSVASISTGMN